MRLESMNKPWLYSCAVCAGLAVMVIAVFGQTYRFDFTDYDDDSYITNNRQVLQGLNVDNVVWAFTTTEMSTWHPLTWLSYLVDIELFGENAGMLHLVNVFWHALNAVLLFLILKSMTGSLWPSAWVAALFAVHPLHVESVAWISERKDVLSTFFMFVTIATYPVYVRRGGVVPYLVVTLGLSLGLLAKPMLVTLPAVFLLLDYWPLGRFNRTTVSDPFTGETPVEVFPALGELPWGRVLRCALEKVPWFALALVTSAATLFVQRYATAPIALHLRIGNAIVSYARYLLNMVWPRNLAALYPYPVGGLPLWQVSVSLVLLVAISGFVAWRMRWSPYLVVGWLWYLGMLVPVIGIIQVGAQALADRYSYVPIIGLFIAVVWGARDLASRWRVPQYALAGAAAVVLPALLVCAFIQTGYWRNSSTLYERAIQVTSNNSLAYFGLANEQARLGRADEAAHLYREALRINPRFVAAYLNFGELLASQGRADEALAQYNKAIQWYPESAADLTNRGIALAKLGRTKEAVTDYVKALEKAPKYVKAYNNLGAALASLGKHQEAIAAYRKALEIDPEYASGHYNLGVVLIKLGRFDEAIAEFTLATQLEPGSAAAHYNLATALVATGRQEEAITHYLEVVRIDPTNRDVFINLGVAMAIAQRFEEAARYYAKAIEIDPTSVKAHNDLARVFLALGRYDEAIQHFRAVLAVDPANGPARDGLARASAAKGGAMGR